MKSKYPENTDRESSEHLEECDIPSDRYRVFIEDVADAFFETDIKGNFVFFNDALCRIFGYPRDEIQNASFRHFMDAENAAMAFESFNRMFRTGSGVNDLIWEITHKDGQKRILEIHASLLGGNKDEWFGFRGIARDVTAEKRNARSNRALARIANALHEFRLLDDRLEYITNEIKELIDIEGASIILLDEENAEFYFRVAAYDDSRAGQKMKEIRFPAEKGVAGQVYRTHRPQLVNDASKSPYIFREVDDKSGLETRSMLDVPIQIQDRMIGVICAVNKKEGRFDQTDVDLLSAIANMVALPIENARINEALTRSYEEVKSFNQAKDRVIHHLSHEIKTPISVLAASLNLLKKKKDRITPPEMERILARAHRNLDRMLDMQYEIEDIVGQRDYKSYTLISSLLDACADEIEVLVADELNSESAAQHIRDKIEDIFGPRNAIPENIVLDRFVINQMALLNPRFSHRSVRMETNLEPTGSILIPADVLVKIVEGLVRNAVENTPDNGLIQISTKAGDEGPIFEVKDHGTGITEENKRLIFDNYFTAYEPAQYASRNSYDFKAGGKGFDLIRLKIFSERYHFKLDMTSVRCKYLTETDQTGANSLEACSRCQHMGDCPNNGGTTMTVRFMPADRPISQEIK